MRVQAVEERLAALEQKIDSFAAEHSEFRSVHVSRRGAEGVRGPQGEQGPEGAPADPKLVAEVAAEIVKKSFRYENEIAKFEIILNELKGEIAVVLASLRWAVIEELKLGGVLDAEGRAVLGPQGERGEQGPKGERGEQGLQGNAGKNGVDGAAGRDGNDGAKGERGLQGEPGVSNIPGPQGERGELGPEGLRGYPGEGLSRTEVIALIQDMKKRGSL